MDEDVPNEKDVYNSVALLSFDDVENLLIRGDGQIDGQGFMWWVREYIGMNHHGRPKIIESRRAKNVEITGVTFKNSPYYHIDIRDAENLYFHDMEIYVDFWG